MHRRAFVAGTVSVLSTSVAGCAAVTGSRHLALEPFDSRHVAYAAEDLSTDQRATLERIREEGSRTTYGHHPFDDATERRHVELEGDFFLIHTGETGERLLRRDVLFADKDTSEEAAANAVVPEAVYGEDDQWRILQAAKNEVADGTRGYVFRGTSSDETDLRITPAYEFVELSLDTPQRATQFDQPPVPAIFRLWVTFAHFLETEYTTTIEPVADAPEDLAVHLDEEGLVDHIDSNDLSSDQRDVLEAAIDGGYTERRPLVSEDSDPFAGVPIAPTLGPETGRSYRIVRYDGEYYTWDVSDGDGDG